MPEAIGETKTEMTLFVAVIRCGCGDPDSHKGQVCPKPRVVEDLGELARKEKES